ncbi:MlaD family protein [Gordonia sp. CPCC 205515]|uniref:MlaD family protein n=1 Tax=Gordonia sp. CPCC 205515 TaxID=3140791 RepID=UPI003AF39D41
MRTRLVIPLIVSAVLLLLSGCGFQGLSSMPIPGGEGTDRGSYEITAMIPTAAGLTTNAPVMIDDATVGSVGQIRIKDWKAQVTLRLNKGTQIPQGSHVMIGMTSVLGSMHLEIVQPEHPEGGMLAPGDEIPLTKCPEQENITTPTDTEPIPDINSAQQVAACTYPTTEQVLSSLSVVLNGGGLTQLGDVVHELDSVFTGRQDVIAKLLPRLNTLVSDLDAQKANIIKAMEGLDRLSASINSQTPTVEKALADGPQILQLLVDQRPHLTDTLAALDRLSHTTNDILDANSADIRNIVKNLSPLLDQLQSTGPALTESLGLLFTFPFVEDKIPGIVRGDYVNGDLVLDLTFDRLKKGMFSSIGLVGPEGVVGAPAGAAKRGLNPFTSPLVPGGGQPRAKAPAAKSVPKPAPKTAAPQGGGN